MARSSAITLLSLALAGCSDAEQVNPLGVIAPPADAGPDVEAPEDAGPDAEPPPQDDAGAPKRTISQRNPFGNVAETENLLWDGDFEWTSPFSDQYGWLSGPPLSYAFSGVRIGAECHSGIKCAAVKKKGNLAAIGVAVVGSKLDASCWAHVKKGTCDLVKASIISIEQGGEPSAPVTAEQTQPGADGWCHYESVIPARTSKPYFLITNQTGDEILIDDAILKKAPPSTALSVKYLAPTSEDLAAVAQARIEILALRGPHDAPPSPAQRAFETWRGRQ
ncbi:MAG: hypothetical protein ABJE95_19105 [Byssovorax sp.]